MAEPHWAPEARGETPLQRADRNFQELLAELRVLQTGVQILFGFLLILAVQPRFAEATTFAQVVYFVTLLLCCAATALLMAPVAYHRALFAKGLKPDIVAASNRFARAGMTALFLAINSAVLLVLDLVADRVVAIVVTAGVAVMFLALWYAAPARKLRKVRAAQG
jgi:sorbitol-specific phosphotransferase system component IIC